MQIIITCIEHRQRRDRSLSDSGSDFGRGVAWERDRSCQGHVQSGAERPYVVLGARAFTGESLGTLVVKRRVGSRRRAEHSHREVIALDEHALGVHGAMCLTALVRPFERSGEASGEDDRLALLEGSSSVDAGREGLHESGSVTCPWAARQPAWRNPSFDAAFLLRRGLLRAATLSRGAQRVAQFSSDRVAVDAV